jgi:hypothetical protein
MIPKWKQVRWNKPSQHGHLVILVVWCIVLTDFEGDDILNLFSLWSLSLLLLDPFFMVSWFRLDSSTWFFVTECPFCLICFFINSSPLWLLSLRKYSYFSWMQAIQPGKHKYRFWKASIWKWSWLLFSSPCQIALENWHPYHRTPSRMIVSMKMASKLLNGLVSNKTSVTHG